MEKSIRTVVVLGASDKRERHSNRAIRLLKSERYRVIPVHPSLETIEGLSVVHSLKEIQEPIDTLTVYLSPERCRPLIDDIIALRPNRVILNPYTEFDEIKERLTKAGIPYLEACTLVMLSTGQF